MRSRPSIQALAAATVSTFLLVVSGAGLWLSLVLLLAVATQVVSGMFWWSLILVRGEGSNSVEFLGVGLALGSLAALLSAQVFRTTALGSWGWLVPCVISAAAFLVPSVHRRSLISIRARNRLARRDLIGLAIALAAGLPTIIAFWVGHPLHWDGYFAYYVDIPFHEALSHSVQTFGPGDNILVVGENLRYHWFSHAWVGALSDWSDAGPFVVLTRLLPLVALLGTVAAGWAWAKRLSSKWWVPATAATLLVAGGYVGTSAVAGDQLIPLSPSQSFTTPWLLVFSLTITLFLRSKMVAPAGTFVLGVLGFGLVGGKVSHAVVIAGGVAGLFAWAIKGKRESRRQVYLAIFACGVGILLGYAVLISGGDGNGFSWGFAYTASRAMGFDSWPFGVVGAILGSGSLLLAIWARWAGLVGWFVPGQGGQPEFAYGAGVFIISMLALIFTTQIAASQLYFALSGSAILTVLSACGLGTLAGPAFDSFVRKPINSGVRLLGAAGVAAGTGAGTYVIGSRMRWFGPVSVWLIAPAGAYLILRRGTIGKISRTTFVATTAMVLAITSVAGLQGANLYSFAKEFRKESAAPATGWHLDYVDAALWLRANSDESDVVLTNRLCSDVNERPPDCSSRWFLTSAVSGRRMWIEGYSYGIGAGDLPQWALDRIDIATRFTVTPNDEDQRTLWNAGVRWLWLDRLVAASEQWLGYGTTEFENLHVVLVRLTDPD